MIIYFLLFITSTVWTITNLLHLGKSCLTTSSEQNFMLLFLYTCLSLTGTILFGYVWYDETKRH